MIQRLRNRLDNLELDLSNEFYDLLEQKDLYELNDIADFDDIGDCFEVRNDLSGNVFDVFVLYVKNGWIRTVRTDDHREQQTFRFDDLSSTIDRINLIELMHEKQ